MGTAKLTRLLAIVAALGLLAAACGGDDADTGADVGTEPAATEPAPGTETPAEEPAATDTAAEPTGQEGTDAEVGGAGIPIGENYDLSGSSFTVGSKEFTEQHVLGQIALQALEAAGADVTDQTGLVGTETVRSALTSGEIDMYWEYTGTAWVNFLGNTTEDVPDDLYGQVAEADEEQNGVHWLEPAPLNNTYAIATTEQFAQENGLETISDAASFIGENPDQGAVCAAAEFINRDDGLPGVEEAYGMEFTEVVELELSLIYAALPQGQCSFGEVFATDARIIANELRVLEDDQDFFVPYNAALTIDQAVFEENSELADLFAPITAALDNDRMIELNSIVDVEGGSYEEAAREFLVGEGFVSE